MAEQINARLAPKNFHQATVVSVYPFDLVERKPGLHPPMFVIAGSKDNEPSVLHVDDGFFYVYLDSDRGSLKVQQPATSIAKSIVDDFISAQYPIYPDARPGIFFVPGQFTPKEIKTTYKETLDRSILEQTNWFKRLVSFADDEWQRHHRHIVITDIQRYAAKALKMDREWLMVAPTDTMLNCPACTTLIPKSAVLCPNCRMILNETEYKKFKFSDAALR